MKRYSIKARAGSIEYFDILSQNEDGYHIRLTRIHEGNRRTIDTFITRQLFELCQKTGYIYEIERAA